VQPEGRCRASVLMLRISSWMSSGCPARSCSSCASLITWASSSSTSATRCWSAGGRTLLASAMFVKAMDSVASMIAPANARPNDRPNDPVADVTPAASPTRSSDMGDSA
jgi:hypothetical protein